MGGHRPDRPADPEQARTPHEAAEDRRQRLALDASSQEGEGVAEGRGGRLVEDILQSKEADDAHACRPVPGEVVVQRIAAWCPHPELQCSEHEGSGRGCRCPGSAGADAGEAGAGALCKGEGRETADGGARAEAGAAGACASGSSLCRGRGAGEAPARGADRAAGARSGGREGGEEKRSCEGHRQDWQHGGGAEGSHIRGHVAAWRGAHEAYAADQGARAEEGEAREAEEATLPPAVCALQAEDGRRGGRFRLGGGNGAVCAAGGDA
mmetsp:Transcript_15708/g.61354  ORF Transcript_15708/g.61354 Transcript_15708/m.61354 type:complete len:267 (-) Transcript_15708:1035-1835(-)